MRSILILARPAPWRQALAARLEQEGCTVELADDAEEARAHLVAPLPGAMLIDCDLPRRSTRRLLTQLETAPSLLGIRRLFVARGLEGDTGPRSGPVFGKPVDPGHIARALRALYPDPERTAAVPLSRPPERLNRVIQAALAN
jgi:CheY-like chemotaxis protein